MTHRQETAYNSIRKLIPDIPRQLQQRLGETETIPVDVAVSVLAGSDPLEFIPLLARLHWHCPPELQAPLSNLIVLLAASLASGSWPRVDAEIRDRLTPLRQQEQLPFPADPGLALVALCHPSGWVREKAVGLVELLPAGIAASLLLVRINDWAKPVRQRAERALSPQLANLSPREKMALVPLVDRLSYSGRHENPQALEVWRMSLVSSFDESEWLKSWNRSHGRDRRIYLELLKPHQEIPGKAVRDALLRSNDRMALLWYLKDVLPKLEGKDRDEATGAISRSLAVPVRRVWLGHLVETLPERAIPLLQEALLDRSSSLRQFARFHLSRLAPLDFVAHYRAALDHPWINAMALRGLAEVSAAEGHREAVSQLSALDPRVQKAAVESLGTDRLGEHLDELVAIAAMAEPGPSTAARKRLIDVAPELGAYLLSHPEITAASPADLQLHFIRIAPFFSKWQGLEYLLLQMLEVDLREEKVKALRMWRTREGRAFVSLKDEPRLRLLMLLDEVDMKNDLEEVLRFTLQRAE